jgi:hypothetical protein
MGWLSSSRIRICMEMIRTRSYLERWSDTLRKKREQWDWDS